MVLSLAGAGCGAPGEPSPRHPVTPQTVSDLAARQQGDAAVLTFTLPTKSTDDDSLAAPPSVEIYNGTLAPGAAMPKKPDMGLVNTIPGDLTKNYQAGGHFQFQVSFNPADVARAPGQQEIYSVRTRAFKGGLSVASAIVILHVYPAPETIHDLRASVTEQAIVLNWTPPDRISTGAALASAPTVRIYRADVTPPAAGAAQQNPPSPAAALSLQLLAPPPAATSAAASEYRDAAFEFGHVYLYSVRSAVTSGSDSVESADSNLVTVPAKDVFPPAAPQALVAVVTPAAAGMPPYVELTWGISTEPDLDGYAVYRSDDANSPGQRLNVELLSAPAFRDASALPAHTYFYRVVALDRAGNESAPSAAVAVNVP